MGTAPGLCIQVGWAIGVSRGTGPGRMFGLSLKYQCRSSRTHGDEILTTRFFTREVRIIFHRRKGARRVWYGGLEESIYFMQFESGSSFNMLTGCLVRRQCRYVTNLIRAVDGLPTSP